MSVVKSIYKWVSSIPNSKSRGIIKIVTTFTTKRKDINNLGKRKDVTGNVNDSKKYL